MARACEVRRLIDDNKRDLDGKACTMVSQLTLWYFMARVLASKGRPSVRVISNSTPSSCTAKYMCMSSGEKARPVVSGEPPKLIASTTVR